MMRCTVMFLAIVLVSSFETDATAHGGDHGPIGMTSFRDDMSPKLRELIDNENRVHGFFVNSSDVFFYQGDTTKLNAFLEGFASLQDAKLNIVINQSLTHAYSPWSRSDRLKANWQLYCSSFDTNAFSEEIDRHSKPDMTEEEIERMREALTAITEGPQIVGVQIRIGDEIELDELDVPENVSLSIATDENQEVTDKIKSFVERHESSRRDTGK